MTTTTPALPITRRRSLRSRLPQLRRPRVSPWTLAALVLWSAIYVGVVTGHTALVVYGGLGVTGASWVALLAWRATHHLEAGDDARLATVWTTVGMLALFGGLLIAQGPIFGELIPILVVGVLLCQRFPTATVLVMCLFTAANGSIRAFLKFSIGPPTDLLIFGMTAALIWRLITRERRASVGLWPGIGVLSAFLIIRAVDMTRAESLVVGLKAYRVAEWYFIAFLAIVFAGWSRETYIRIGKWMVALAAVIGCYAVARKFVGPSGSESRVAIAVGGDYNTVDGGGLRLFGSFEGGHPLAVWCATSLPLCFAAALVWRDRWLPVALVAIGALTFAMLATKVRAAIPASVVGISVTFILYLVNSAFPSGTRLSRGIIGFAGMVVASAALFVASGGTSGDSFQRYSAILHPGNDNSFSEHRFKWAQVLSDVSSHPTGFGLGSAGRVHDVGGRFVNISNISIDNSYLLLAYEGGLAIMALFAVALLLILAQLAWRGARARGPDTAMMAIGAAGGLTAFMILMIGNNYLESFQALWAWTLVAVAIGALGPATAKTELR
jgi:hypothetical protein